jgi:hypothetical protein
MSLYKFEPDDILFNRIETHPRVKFVLHTSSVIYNDNVNEFGISNGETALSRLSTLSSSADPGPYSFITKDSSRVGFKTITLSAFNSRQFGEVMTASLPMTATLDNEYYNSSCSGSCRLHVQALKNISNFYTILSDHYSYSSSLGDKDSQTLRLFSVPSIFYGSSIEKGTVGLKFYITGTLIGELKDVYENGNLIQVAPSGSTGSGSVAGLVYYDEGFLLLTGSWDITTEHSEDYIGATSDNPKWIYFGATGSLTTSTVSSSYEMTMSGTQYVPVMTMLAHADKTHLNHSNNPTCFSYGQLSNIANPQGASTGSLGYYEKTNLKIKNVAKYPYTNDTGSFKKETYVSKIGIYDDQKNLIGIAKMATPVRKRENDQFTFKMKLDI